jgi:hypothetical protein
MRAARCSLSGSNNVRFGGSAAALHQMDWLRCMCLLILPTAGRMKYVRPLYRALYKAGPKGQKLAVETFLKHKYGLANTMVGFLSCMPFSHSSARTGCDTGNEKLKCLRELLLSHHQVHHL